MPFSAKRPAYSDNPSEASHSVIVDNGFSLTSVQRGEGTGKPVPILPPEPTANEFPETKDRKKVALRSLLRNLGMRQNNG
jgi:hypothetical protein